MSQRVLRSTTATLRATFKDQEGEDAAPSEPVTVVITDSAGDEVASGTATVTGDDVPGEVTYSLTAAQTAALDLLTAVWTDDDGVTVTSSVEIVGGFYFTVAEARESDKILKASEKYTDADIRRVRAEVEVECERITGRSFVPRFRRIVTTSPGGTRLRLLDSEVRSVLSMSAAGVPVSGSFANVTGLGAGILEWPLNELAPGNATSVVNPFGAEGSLLEIAYEYGWDAPPPDLKSAALLRLRHRLTRPDSGIPDRASTFTSTEGGTYSLITPGMRGAKTGIPDVDSVYADYTIMDDLDAYSVALA